MRLGDAYAATGSFDEARERYGEAGRLFEAIGDLERRLNVLNNLAYAEYESGDAQRAGPAAEKMRKLAESSGFGLNPPFLDTLARIHILLGEYDKAESALEDALAAFASGGDVQAVTPAEFMLTQAEAQRRQGRLEEHSRPSIDVGDLRREIPHRGRGRGPARAGRTPCRRRALRPALETYKTFHAEVVSLNSNRREVAARTREAMFGTEEAQGVARRFRLQVRTDGLTGLPNRRSVNEELPARLNDVLAGVPVVVAVFDADHFKDVTMLCPMRLGTSRCANSAGCSRPARVRLRRPRVSPSFVARLGGDKFLAVLPGLELSAATTVLETMRATVEDHQWRRSSASCD